MVVLSIKSILICLLNVELYVIEAAYLRHDLLHNSLLISNENKYPHMLLI